VPANSYVLIDATRADFIDQDVIEEINNFLIHAYLKNIRTEIKRSENKPMQSLITPLKKVNHETLRETVA
jgi:retron-type reverse transcriptase